MKPRMVASHPAKQASESTTLVVFPLNAKVELDDPAEGPPVGIAGPVCSGAVQTPPLSRGGRPKTRSLRCDICGAVYQQRSGILRHLRNVHDRDSRGNPIMPLEIVSVESVSPPKRPDGNHFISGMRHPRSSTSARSSISGVPGEFHKLKRAYLPDMSEVQSSRRVPVKLLIREIDDNPSASPQELAESLKNTHGWDQEATDIAEERLSDLKAQRKDIAIRIKLALPIEQSSSRLQAFIPKLQDLMDVIDATDG